MLPLDTASDGEQRLDAIRVFNDQINNLARELHELRREDLRRALARAAKTEVVPNA